MEKPVPARISIDDQDYAAEDVPLSYFPETFIVLRLNPYIRPEAASWLVRKISGKKSDGAAELLVRCEPYGGRKKEVPEEGVFVIFHYEIQFKLY